MPLILRLPGRIPAGRRVSAVVGIEDVGATIGDLIGLKNLSIAGTSLVPFWVGPEARAERGFSVSELSQFPFAGMEAWPSYHGAIKALIGPRWHYIAHEKFGQALYDWETDPQEAHDVAKTAEGQKIAAEYADRLQAILARTARGTPQGRLGHTSATSQQHHF